MPLRAEVILEFDGTAVAVRDVEGEGGDVARQTRFHGHEVSVRGLRRGEVPFDAVRALGTGEGIVETEGVRAAARVGEVGVEPIRSAGVRVEFGVPDARFVAREVQVAEIPGALAPLAGPHQRVQVSQLRRRTAVDLVGAEAGTLRRPGTALRWQARVASMRQRSRAEKSDLSTRRRSRRPATVDLRQPVVSRLGRPPWTPASPTKSSRRADGARGTFAPTPHPEGDAHGRRHLLRSGRAIARRFRRPTAFGATLAP